MASEIPKHRGGLLDRHAAEEPAFDDARVSRVQLRELVQGGVEVEDAIRLATGKSAASASDTCGAPPPRLTRLPAAGVS